MNRLVCVAMIALALAAFGSGCCCMDRYYYGDCTRPAMWGRIGCQDGTCGGGGYDDGCADGSCGGDTCHGGACNSGGCATNDCGGCGRCDLCSFNPLRSLFNAIHCSSGCGEFYFDEWINDPPAACDPCDNHGGYVGPRCCPPRWFLGHRNTSCYDCAANCDTSCGFDSGCGTPGCTSCGQGGPTGDMHEGEMIETVPTPEPHMAEPAPAMARRPAKPYYSKGAQRANYSAPQGKPTPAVRRTSHTTTAAPTTAKKPVGSGVRRG